MNNDDLYAIERDERDIGGELFEVEVYTGFQAAWAAWKETQTPSDERVTLWLVRRIGGSSDFGKTIVIDSKCK